jgi:exodeoxyribonuclease-3
MKISSRNVNGIRAVMKKDFFSRIKMNNADIICLQEVKAFANQIPPEIRFYLPNYEFLRHHGTRAGYAGTAILYKKDITIREKKADFENTCFSDDGRVTQLDFQYNNQEISLLNIYFPNG